jgi:hypothetical protein
MLIIEDTKALREVGILINTLHQVTICIHCPRTGTDLRGRIVPESGPGGNGNEKEMDCMEGIT